MTRWTEDDLARAEDLLRRTGMSLRCLAKETGIPFASLWYQATKRGWPLTNRGPGRPRNPTALQRRQALARRALGVAERHMQDLEAQAGGPEPDKGATERGTKALAAMIRMLRELAQLEAPSAKRAEQRAPDGAGEADEHGADAPARHPDAIRQDFARLLAERFPQERRDGPAGPPP